MLVATPSSVTLGDRKPRVISEIRKPHVLRSPSLDGLSRLSGVLNYLSPSCGVWSQRLVCVREGCLLVYGPDGPPPALPGGPPALQGPPPGLQSIAPLRKCASLERGAGGMLKDRGRYSSYQQFRDNNAGYLLSSGKQALSGCSSLGRKRSTKPTELRITLRHLNLLTSPVAPRAFCLSSTQHQGDDDTPLAVFQALRELDYERWVKTLAVEIMRQTPLEAIRFLDVLGIASIPATPATTPAAPTQPAAEPQEEKKSRISQQRAPAAKSAPRWDRSPSSEGSTTSADFVTHGKKIIQRETISKAKRCSLMGQSLPRRKLHMSDVESQSDRDEVDCVQPVKETIVTDVKNGSSGRRSREKFRRFKDNNDGSSSEDMRATDEGIVLEERGSSSDRSCRRALWLSDRSDCLDSPHSVSSYSSYELCASPDTTDSVDGTSFNPQHKTNIEINYPNQSIISQVTGGRGYSKNSIITTSNSNVIMKKKCSRRKLPEKISPVADKEEKYLLDSELTKDYDSERKTQSLPYILYRAQPFVDTPPYISKQPKVLPDLNTDSPNTSITEQADHLTPLIVVDTADSWNKADMVWNRARSCSPQNSGPCTLPRFQSSGRQKRALSAGQDLLHTSPAMPSTVEALKERCQNTESYVPVREKLALFESLCRVGRLARSSEELAAGDHVMPAIEASAPRARSLHDLTRSRSPQVPVREMCKFFEKFGTMKSEKNKLNTKKNECAVNASDPKLKSLKVTSKLKDNILNLEKPQKIVETHNEPTIKSVDFGFNEKYNGKRSDHQNEDSTLCEAFNYACFRQIRQGNKIITYV